MRFLELEAFLELESRGLAIVGDQEEGQVKDDSYVSGLVWMQGLFVRWEKKIRARNQESTVGQVVK